MAKSAATQAKEQPKAAFETTTDLSREGVTEISTALRQLLADTFALYLKTKNFHWHNDPIPQYVITLAGVLEFTTLGGETFTIHPGDVLVAEDHTGSGHKWRLTNDEPWKRAYVVFKKGADTQFVPDPA